MYVKTLHIYKHKRRSPLGERGFSSANIFSDKGREEFFGCERPHFLVENTSDFSKFIVCPHGQGGRGREGVSGVASGGT